MLRCRHDSKIDSMIFWPQETSLFVPFEFQFPIPVSGAGWIYRRLSRWMGSLTTVSTRGKKKKKRKKGKKKPSDPSCAMLRIAVNLDSHRANRKFERGGRGQGFSVIINESDNFNFSHIYLVFFFVLSAQRKL